MLIRALAILFLYDLALPSIFLVLRPNIRSVYFNSYHGTSVVAIFLIWVFLTLFTIAPPKRLVFFQRPAGKFLDFFNKRIFVFFVFLFFISSLYFYINYDMSFRHLNRIKNTNILVTIMFALRPFFRLWILVETFRVIREKFLSRRKIIISACLGVSFYFSATSASDLITLLMCVALVFCMRVEVVQFYRLRFLSFKTLLVSLAIFSVIYLGFANKKKVEDRVSIIEFVDDFGGLYLDALLARLSVHTVSSYIAAENALSYDTYKSWISEVNFTFINNSLKLIGNGYLDEIHTLARRNYFAIFSQSRESSRTGTSPGFIASFLYMPFFPLNILLGIAFYRFLFSRIYYGLSFRKIPILLMFISVFVLAPFIDGFQHLFYVIDPISISFFYFILITDKYVRN